MSLLLALTGGGGSGYTVTANTGTYVVTGSPASLLRGYRLVADSGSYAVTGQSANITRSRLLTAAAGSYSVTGQSATILKSKVLQSASGAYVVSGNNANIVYTPVSGGYTLTAESGSYSVSGKNATITFTGGTQVIHGGGGHTHGGITPHGNSHKLPTFEDYLKSTEKEDREYLEKLEISEKAEIFTAIKTEALAPIGNLYHNIENDREKLKLSLINQGIAYREAYLEVYNELVYEYRQAQEDEAIAMVIVAML
jgi:hypothetical protein